MKVVERLATAAELLRVLAALRDVEAARVRGGPARSLERLRRRGRSARARSGAGRERLRRAIRWVDRFTRGGGNCYRRALLEIALDRDAASGALLLGLDPAGGPGSGHAWLEGDVPDRDYPTVIRL